MSTQKRSEFYMCNCCVAEAAEGRSTKLCNHVTRLRRDGRTALHLAAGQNRVEVAKVLLENGADVNAKDK
jgi:hypothetical protein